MGVRQRTPIQLRMWRLIRRLPSSHWIIGHISKYDFRRAQSSSCAAPDATSAMKRTLLLHFALLLSTLVCSLGQNPETQNAAAPRKAALTGRVLNAASGDPVKKSHLALSKPANAGSTDAA